MRFLLLTKIQWWWSMSKEVVVVEETKKDVPYQLPLKPDGSPDLSTNRAKIHFAQGLMRDDMVSKTFKTPQQVVQGIMLCEGLNVDPRIGMKMLYVIDGKPSLYGDGPLMLCRRTGLISHWKEYYVNEAGDEICPANKNLADVPFAAVTEVGRKDEEGIQIDYFTQNDIDTSGVNINKYGEKMTWRKHRAIMMRYRARTKALKSKFGDLLNGAPITEYISEDAPKEGFATHTPTNRADELTRKYLG